MTTAPFDGDYTLPEVAAILRRSVDRVRKMANRGDLAAAGAYQLGARCRWRFRRYDFDRWHAALSAPRPAESAAPTAWLEPPSRRSLAHRKRKPLA